MKTTISVKKYKETLLKELSKAKDRMMSELDNLDESAVCSRYTEQSIDSAKQSIKHSIMQIESYCELINMAEDTIEIDSEDLYGIKLYQSHEGCAYLNEKRGEK